MNKIFFFALLSVLAQPAHSMSSIRYSNYSSHKSSYHNPIATLDSDTLLIGGAVVAATGLCYWLYRSNYKSSLAQSHGSLNASASAMQGLVKIYYDESVNPDSEIFAEITSSEAALPLQSAIAAHARTVHDLIVETRKHAQEWRGYKDYRHAEAESLIKSGNDLTTHLAALKKELNHRIATFVLQDGTIQFTAQQYSMEYNPLVNVTSLEAAYEYQRRLTTNAKTVQQSMDALQSYISEWSKHAGNKVATAKDLLILGTRVQANMSSIQTSLTALIAEYELQHCYLATDATFRPYLNLLAQPDRLKEEIFGDHYDKAYPLLEYTNFIEKARDNLLAKMRAVTAQQNSDKHHSGLLLDELQLLIRAVANMPEHAIEKTNKRMADAAQEALRAQNQRAREERESQERIAQKERESQERRAREDREAKERHNRAMLEEQRRLTRAKEQEAAAALGKADAEHRKARVEEERLRLDRQRFELERQKLAQQPATNNINITVKKNSDATRLHQDF